MANPVFHIHNQMANGIFVFRQKHLTHVVTCCGKHVISTLRSFEVRPHSQPVVRANVERGIQIIHETFGWRQIGKARVAAYRVNLLHRCDGIEYGYVYTPHGWKQCLQITNWKKESNRRRISVIFAPHVFFLRKVRLHMKKFFLFIFNFGRNTE